MRSLGPLLTLLAAVSCARAAAVPEGRPVPAEFADFEQQVYERINRYRAAVSLPRLAWDERIASVARAHSRAMAEGLPFGHSGFGERVESIAAVIPLRGASENVASNNRPRHLTAGAAVDGLLASRDHLANIEGRYDVTGVGVARSAEGEFFFTQLFVLKR